MNELIKAWKEYKENHGAEILMSAIVGHDLFQGFMDWLVEQEK